MLGYLLFDCNYKLLTRVREDVGCGWVIEAGAALASASVACVYSVEFAYNTRTGIGTTPTDHGANVRL